MEPDPNFGQFRISENDVNQMLILEIEAPAVRDQYPRDATEGIVGVIEVRRRFDPAKLEGGVSFNDDQRNLSSSDTLVDLNNERCT